MNLTHVEVVEYRQRIADYNRKRGEASDAELKIRRWIDSMARKYNVVGQRYNFNPETAEIEITPEVVHYQGWQSVCHAEKAAVGRNLWTEEIIEEPHVPTTFSETGR